MPITRFPLIDTADEHGLLAIGGDLDLDTLVLAYSQGIFPWPISVDYPLAWFSPDPRGILAFENLHISNSLKKFFKKNPFEVRFNTNFSEVIRNCAIAKRALDQGTWITPDIIDAYINLHHEGLAYSSETYLDGKLVGGVYGVCINRYYSGESMFHLVPNASKIALVSLLYRLHQQGIEWIDTQMVTPVVASLGGIEVPREIFLKMLDYAISE